MKKTYRYFLLGCFLLMHASLVLVAVEPGTAVSAVFTLDVKDPVVTLLSPAGGEVLNHNQPVQVSWQVEDDNLVPNSVSVVIHLVPGDSIYTLIDHANAVMNTQLNLPNILTTQAILAVTAKDQFGNTGTAQSRGFITLTDGSTGVVENQALAQDGLLSYPNPAQDKIWVEFSSDGASAVQLSLISMNGQLLNSQIITDTGRVLTSFDLTGLVPGIYLIKLNSGSKQLSNKFIVR